MATFNAVLHAWDLLSPTATVAAGVTTRAVAFKDLRNRLSHRHTPPPRC